MTGAACHTCKRTLRPGESAWASAWKVLDTSESALSAMEFRTETRYTCDDCEAAR